jgi:hypothetical protein
VYVEEAREEAIGKQLKRRAGDDIKDFDPSKPMATNI